MIYHCIYNMNYIICIFFNYLFSHFKTLNHEKQNFIKKQKRDFKQFENFNYIKSKIFKL